MSKMRDMHTKRWSADMIFGSHTTNKIVQYNSGKSNTEKKQSKVKKEKTFKCSLFCEGGALALKEKLSKQNLTVWAFWQCVDIYILKKASLTVNQSRSLWETCSHKGRNTTICFFFIWLSKYFFVVVAICSLDQVNIGDGISWQSCNWQQISCFCKHLKTI